MSYCGYVTTIKELRKHSNADRLQVATLFSNDVIVGLDMQIGDKVLYFPTDGKLGLEFARVNKLLREKDENGNQTGGYLDPDKRHIRSMKLRGEMSDGLVMPIESLSSFGDISQLNEGDTITTFGGTLICEKYIPRGKNNGDGLPKAKKAKEAPTESYPFFEQHLDTQQLAYNTQKFKTGDICYITLKLHGTSQRTAHTIKQVHKKSFMDKLINKVIGKRKLANDWEYITGTRRVTLKNYDGGFYGGNQFRRKWHEFFEDKLHKGEEVYYEVVGFTDEGAPIMPSCDNKKTKDKEFIKKFGDTTAFTYGCGEKESAIHVYRMTMTNEDGVTVEYPTELVRLRCEQMGVNFVPIFKMFVFNESVDLMEMVQEYEDAVDPIGKTHIMEGVIVRIDNKEKFTAYKHKTRNFKILEGIIKADDVLDMEEADSSQEEEVVA